jgi:hypothetical protein
MPKKYFTIPKAYCTMPKGYYHMPMLQFSSSGGMPQAGQAYIKKITFYTFTYTLKK